MQFNRFMRTQIECCNISQCRFLWPRVLRHRSVVARSCWDRGFESHRGHGCLSVVSVVVLSGTGLCDELITRPEESYRLWCVVVCDLETSWMRRPWPTGGCCAKKNFIQCRSQWSRSLKRRSAAARLLRLWVRFLRDMDVCLLWVLCCQVEVSVTSWSLVQKSPTDSGVSLCVI